MENLIPLFVALTAIAVLLQAGVLVALYFAVRKTSSRLEAVSEEVKTKALPTIDAAQSLLAELRPKLQVVAENMMEATTTVRSQVERVDATVNDALDRARLQVISNTFVYGSRITIITVHNVNVEPVVFRILPVIVLG